jgi:RNA polymerase sigma-70 factor (ECF subfamily)
LRAYARAAAPNREEAGLDAVDARLDAVDAGPALALALSALGPGERDALLLHAWAGFTYEQIALALDLPVGTVRSRLHRARKVMREPFERNGEELSEPTASAPVWTRRETQ